MKVLPQQSSLLVCCALHVVIRDGQRGASAFSTSTSSSARGMPPLTTSMDEHMTLAKKAMSYFDSSPDPFHCVQTSIDSLEAAGFVGLPTDEAYKGKLEPGGKYYFTKNKSTLVAFAIGEKYTSMDGGFKIIGGHTDSPNLKIKPRSKRSSSGYCQLGVECYGGGLWHTWFDRDLGLSGRVLVYGENNSIEQRLVKIDRPVLRIPNLAIHLQTTSEREAFAVNKEDHLAPILAHEAKKALTGDSYKNDNEPEGSWKASQEPLLLDLLASELSVDVGAIADFELNLFDVQKASLGGVRSEFLHSARLDNLASCFMALEGLLGHIEDGHLSSDSDIPLVVMFDHEEIGSLSATGAGSPIIADAVRRITTALYHDDNTNSVKQDWLASCLNKSFVLSSDQAHAIHPNYASKHEKQHAPKMNGGMVIKTNVNQRYATNGITAFIIREIARRAGLPPVQEFVVRQDCGCGSTIGPTISANTGIRAIDMGCPQLSMHSIRETMGVADLTNGLALFKAYFKHFREVDSSIKH